MAKAVRRAGSALVFAAAVASSGAAAALTVPELPVSGRVRSADGVEIAYAERAGGALTILFIHGGLADRTFWSLQFAELPKEYRLVALDLAGHGASGANRDAMTIGAWAADVRAVADALKLGRIVLVGNSLGGPVALEAAALLKGRAIGVVGVDTLHDAMQQMPKEVAHAQAEALRKDFAGGCHGLVEALFHPGTQAELKAWAEHRMCGVPRPMAASMIEGFGGYDTARAFRNAGVPIRAINGDLWPTKVEANRTVTPDFDAVIIKGAGHYPMLESPGEFNRLLLEYVRALDRAAARR